MNSSKEGTLINEKGYTLIFTNRFFMFRCHDDLVRANWL